MKRKKTLLVLASLFILIFGVRSANRHLTKSIACGASKDGFGNCPDRPSCVSTRAENSGQRMQPIELTVSSEQGLNRIASIIRSMPRSSIVIQKDGYLRAEFRSLLFAFVDDVEFMVDEANRVIDYRSVSRIGYSDLGANRKRMNRIRREYEKQSSR